MILRLEEIDLTKIKSLYFLRGYIDENEENYCMVMTLLGDDKNQYEIKLWLQDHKQKMLTTKDMEDLVQYLNKKGMELHADVLESDFDRFWIKIKSKRVKIEEI